MKPQLISQLNVLCDHWHNAIQEAVFCPCNGPVCHIQVATVRSCLVHTQSNSEWWVVAFVHFQNWFVENVIGVLWRCVSGGRPRQRHLFYTRTIRGNDVPMSVRTGMQSTIVRGPRPLPTELLREIICFTLGPYLSDVLIAPASTRSWNPVRTLLHTNYHFRSCTLSVCNEVWALSFINHRTGCVVFTQYPGIHTQKQRNQIKAPTKLYKQDRIFAYSCRTCTD